MSCFNAEHIHRYLDGDLDRAAREEFEHHLELCPACRRAVDERRLLDEAARSLPALELPPDFSQRIMARLEDRPRVSAFGWLALGATAFVSLVSVMIGVFVLAGYSLTELVTGLEGFIVNTFKNGAVLFGKATSLVGLLLSVFRHLLSALWDGLSGLTTVIPWPAWVLILGLLTVLVSLSIYGLRKILSGVQS